jgi:hypothetical protein
MCAFEGLKNVFNTQKVRLKKKKSRLVKKKKIKNAFECSKSLKMAKIHF